MKMTGEDCHTSQLATTNIKESKYQVNLDAPSDYSELNISVTNYVVAEFVVVPSDFDLHSHLSMREQVGLFKVKEFDLAKALIITDAIKSAPVFNTMNNANLHPKYCFFLLQLFSELNLIVKSIDNPFRRYIDDKIYLEFARSWNNERQMHNIRGQDVSRISFVFINLFHIFHESVYSEALKAVEEVQRYQKEIDKFNTNLDER